MFQKKNQNAKNMQKLKESYASKISDLNAQLKNRAHQINQLEEKVMNPYFQFLYTKSKVPVL